MLRLGVLGAFAIGLLLASPRLADGAIGVLHNNWVHYIGHLVAGRLLSLCPCATSLAETQYRKGMYHARTPQQVALLTDRPASVRAWLGETRGLVLSGLQHLSRPTA